MLDQISSDFHEDRKKSYEEYNVKIMKEQNLRLFFEITVESGQTWSLHKSRTINSASNEFVSYAVK